ncbi:MAG: hypothetical protein KIS88_02040 [Anaerolineales bacterium]|nr:hypothetical protein [Anaerolineales bacterium]
MSIPAHIRTAQAWLAAWLRRDTAAIIAYLFATAVMTYPLALELAGNGMPVGGDLYMKLWDVWWFERMQATGQSFYYSKEIFYPLGLDLSFHPASWTTTLVIWALAPLMGVFGAYKLMILVAVFSSAYAAYLLALWLTKNRVAAWFGGAIYSFAPYHLSDLRGHPDLSQLAFIPLAVLCLLLAFKQRRVWMAGLAGILLGLVAWTGLYLFGFAALTLGFVLAYEALIERGWRTQQFWQLCGVFTLAAAALLLPRLLPVFNDRASLEYVIENKFTAYESQADLLSYFVPPPANRLLAPLLGELSNRIAPSISVYPSPYIGWVALLTSLSALLFAKKRKAVWFWGVVAALFLILSLGPALRFAGRVYSQVPLPAVVLIDRVQIFRSVRPILFHIGLLLPLGMLAAFGLDGWLGKLKQTPQVSAGLVVLLATVLFAEYWIGTFSLRPLEASPIYQQIANDENQFAVIDLPMGYGPSKYYLFLQTVHGKPMVEGMSSRMPPNAFDYINGNLLLALWHAEEHLDCTDFKMASMTEAIDALSADGFKYILVHEPVFADYFEGVPITATDPDLTVYALDDLRDFFPCP